MVHRCDLLSVVVRLWDVGFLQISLFVVCLCPLLLVVRSRVATYLSWLLVVVHYEITWSTGVGGRGSGRGGGAW